MESHQKDILSLVLGPTVYPGGYQAETFAGWKSAEKGSVEDENIG